MMDWVAIWSVVLAGVILFTSLTADEGEKVFHRVLAAMLFLPPLGRTWGWW